MKVFTIDLQPLWNVYGHSMDYCHKYTSEKAESLDAVPIPIASNGTDHAPAVKAGTGETSAREERLVDKEGNSTIWRYIDTIARKFNNKNDIFRF